MTTTSCPARCVARHRSGMFRIRSIDPTDVPPYFCTTSATTRGLLACYGPRRHMGAYGSYLLQTFITLIVVCGLAFVVLWGARRLGVGRPRGAVKLVGHLPLDA